MGPLEINKGSYIGCFGSVKRIFGSNLWFGPVLDGTPWTQNRSKLIDLLKIYFFRIKTSSKIVLLYSQK